MNLTLFQHQIKRNLLSWRMLIIVGISFILIFVQYWTTYHASYHRDNSAKTFLKDVLLFNRDGTGSGLYLLILPFIAALLGGSIFASERYSGRLRALYVRDAHKRVIHTSVLSGFLLGGIGGVLPLVIDIIICAALNPSLDFVNGYAVHANGFVEDRFVLIASDSWIYPLYEFNQIVFIIVMVLLVFVLSGLFATLAIASSYFIHRRHIELLIPFVVSFVLWMAPAFTLGLVPDQWSHTIFLSFAFGSDSTWYLSQNIVGVIINLVGLLAITVAATLVEQRKDVL